MMNKIIPISGLIALRPFPTESCMRWRRMDVPGHKEARVERTTSGWRLTGELNVEEAGLAARLHYAIECDPEWRTRPASIARLIMRQGLSLTLFGIMLGLVSAVASTRFLSSYLYGVAQHDPLTFTVVGVLLLSVAALACYLPARRATKVDPLIALRHD